jgi:hypothetical protein
VDGYVCVRASLHTSFSCGVSVCVGGWLRLCTCFPAYEFFLWCVCVCGWMCTFVYMLPCIRVFHVCDGVGVHVYRRAYICASLQVGDRNCLTSEMVSVRQSTAD